MSISKLSFPAKITLQMFFILVDFILILTWQIYHKKYIFTCNFNVYDFNNLGTLDLVKHIPELYIYISTMAQNSFIMSQIMKLDSVLLFIKLRQFFVAYAHDTYSIALRFDSSLISDTINYSK